MRLVAEPGVEAAQAPLEAAQAPGLPQKQPCQLATAAAAAIVRARLTVMVGLLSLAVGPGPFDARCLSQCQDRLLC